MEILKTDYKDDIMASGTTSRKYTQLTNSDGTFSLVDKTPYEQKGDLFGANDINKTNREVNRINNYESVMLLASGWTGDSAPYTQTVSVPNARADDNPVLVSLLEDGAVPTVQNAYMKAFGRISAGTAVTSNGSVTFKVYKKPATDITIGLKGVL